jgi:hypothetical protein
MSEPSAERTRDILAGIGDVAAAFTPPVLKALGNGMIAAPQIKQQPCGGAASLAAEWGQKHSLLADQGRRLLPSQSFERQSFGNSALQNQPSKEM